MLTKFIIVKILMGSLSLSESLELKNRLDHKLLHGDVSLLGVGVNETIQHSVESQIDNIIENENGRLLLRNGDAPS